MKFELPSEVKIYFWGDNLDQLTWIDHKNYIVQTLLEKGDVKALNWLFQHITNTDLKSLLPSLKLQPKSSNFWQIYLS